MQRRRGRGEPVSAASASLRTLRLTGQLPAAPAAPDEHAVVVPFMQMNADSTVLFCSHLPLAHRLLDSISRCLTDLCPSPVAAAGDIADRGLPARPPLPDPIRSVQHGSAASGNYSLTFPLTAGTEEVFSNLVRTPILCSGIHACHPSRQQSRSNPIVLRETVRTLRQTIPLYRCPTETKRRDPMHAAATAMDRCTRVIPPRPAVLPRPSVSTARSWRPSEPSITPRPWLTPPSGCATAASRRPAAGNGPCQLLRQRQELPLAEVAQSGRVRGWTRSNRRKEPRAGPPRRRRGRTPCQAVQATNRPPLLGGAAQPCREAEAEPCT